MVKRTHTIENKNPQHNQIWEWEETPELAAYIAKQTGKEHTVNIKKGSVLVFPALYLFPHEVTPATKGVRYSWIQWLV